MKKHILLALTAALVLTSLTACSNKSSGTSNASATSDTSNTGDVSESPDVDTEVIVDGTELTSEEELEYLQNLEVISSEYEEYEASLPRLEEYTVDGYIHHSGDTLQSFLDNDWIIYGDSFDENIEISADDEIEPLGEENLLLNSATSLIQVGVLNISQTETKKLSDCVIISVSVEQPRSQACQSITVNQIDVYQMPYLDLSYLSPNQGTGGTYYSGYYPVPDSDSEDSAENSTESSVVPGADVTLLGWTLSLSDEDGDEVVDTVIFNADFTYQ